MMLDDLYELIETLQARIAQHDSALQQSEALTRYALIDPLLRGLGWDTGDPSQVLVEFRLPKGAQKGFADYALFGSDTQPLLIVEAKSLNSPLEEAAAQALGYCNVLGIPHFAVTDGERWRLFETFRPVALEKKLVVGLSLKGRVAETCLDALALWRPSVASGSIKTAAAPVVDKQAPVTDTPAPPGAAPTVSDDERWHQLSEFQPERGTKPAAIRHSNGQVKAVDSWADLCAEIVRWLKSSGRLTEQHLPVRIGRGQVYFVNRSNANGKGTQFKSYRQVDSWFVNANYNAKQQAHNARGVIQTAGLDPATFAVKLQ